MATLNYRYSGQIVSLPDTGEYEVGTFGTARLNVKVNETSTAKFGLCSHVNSISYDKLRFRINGTICGIGRTASLEYISGNTPDRNGSTTFATNSAREVTSVEEINKRTYYAGTSDVAPVIGRKTENNTGRTEIVSIDNERLVDHYWAVTYNPKRTSTRQWTREKVNNTSLVSSMVQSVSYSDVFSTVTHPSIAFTNKSLEGDINSYAQTTKSTLNFTTVEQRTAKTTSGTTSSSNNGTTVTGSWIGTYTSQYKVNYATSQKSFVTRRLQSQINTVTSYANVVYSTRWSYTVTSCKFNSLYRTTVSESLHNFNM